MKKQLFIAILFISLILLGASAVMAQEPEAGAAAQLTLHSVETDTRPARLEAYLTSFNSPLAKEAKHIVAEADRLNIDWKLIPAIAGLESTFCRAIPNGSYNCWGWGIPTGAQRGVAFTSYENGVTIVSEGLRFNYINRGATTLEGIGRVYAASPTWAYRVRFFINQIEDFTPFKPSLLDVTI